MFEVGGTSPRDDPRLKTKCVSVPSPKGNGTVSGYLVRFANAIGKLPGIIVVHENRGLNPYMEDVARRLGGLGYMAFAPDGKSTAGGYPGNEEKGEGTFQNV